MMTNKPRYSVNVDSPIAVYVQIENQVQFEVAAGRLRPGDSLPSVREMAAMLNVNPNTITKSYRDLELMQIVNTRRGVGVTVTDKAVSACRSSVLAMVKGHLAEAVAECVASGLNATEIRKVVSQAIEAGALPYRKN